MKNTTQILPKGQKKLIIKALKAFERTLKIYSEGIDTPTYDEIGFDIFDLNQLIGLMNYDVTINLPIERKEKFCHYHNVDFPLYETDIQLEYPVEEKRKFAVYFLPGYEPSSEIVSYFEIGNSYGFDDEFLKVIDNLEVKQRAEKENVLVIRIK